MGFCKPKFRPKNWHLKQPQIENLDLTPGEGPKNFQIRDVLEAPPPTVKKTLSETPPSE